MNTFLTQFSSDIKFRCLLIAGLFLLGIIDISALSAPPTVSDRAFGQSLRAELDQIRNSYSEGRISRPVANRRTATSFAKALSPGGLRFQREFPKGVHLDFMRKDISKVINNALSGNTTNWHGFYRELKYINAAVAPGSPFELVEAGSRQRIKEGREVEFDSLFRDRRTGKTLVIEIKDKKITRSNLEATKDQIAKIAKRARQEGVSRATWINRRAVPESMRSELMDFADKKGVAIYDQVTTGKVKPGEQHIDHVLAKESRLVARESARRVVKVIPYVGVAIETGFAIHKGWQWQTGKVPDRDMVIATGSATSGIAGVLLGAKIGGEGGAWVGSFFGPGPGTAIGGTVGAVFGGAVGGIAGHIAGNKTTEYAVDKFYYEKQSEKEREATIAALLSHYSVIE